MVSSRGPEVGRAICFSRGYSPDYPSHPVSAVLWRELSLRLTPRANKRRPPTSRTAAPWFRFACGTLLALVQHKNVRVASNKYVIHLAVRALEPGRVGFLLSLFPLAVCARHHLLAVLDCGLIVFDHKLIRAWFNHSVPELHRLIDIERGALRFRIRRLVRLCHHRQCQRGRCQDQPNTQCHFPHLVFSCLGQSSLAGRAAAAGSCITQWNRRRKPAAGSHYARRFCDRAWDRMSALQKFRIRAARSHRACNKHSDSAALGCLRMPKRLCGPPGVTPTGSPSEASCFCGVICSTNHETNSQSRSNSRSTSHDLDVTQALIVTVGIAVFLRVTRLVRPNTVAYRSVLRTPLAGPYQSHPTGSLPGTLRPALCWCKACSQCTAGDRR